MADDVEEVIGTLTTVMALSYNSYLGSLSTVSNAVNNFYKFATSSRDKDLASQLVNAVKVREALVKSFVAGNLPTNIYSANLRQIDSAIVGIKTLVAENEIAASSFKMLGIAGAAVAAAIIYSWAKVAPLISDTVQRAERIGSSTTFLEVWNEASLLAGQNTEAFAQSIEGLHKNIMQLSIQPIQSMNDLLSGGNKPFTMLGLSAFQLKGLGGDEQLKIIADRLSLVTDKTLQLTIAQELFGDSGFYMLKYLKQGAAGVDELQSKMQSFNIVISDTQAQSIQDAVVAWRELKLAMQGVYEQISVAVAPALLMVLNILTITAQVVSTIVSGFNSLFGFIDKIANFAYVHGPNLWGGKDRTPYNPTSSSNQQPNSQLTTLIGVGRQSLATQQSFVDQLKRSAPPHPPYSW